MDSDKFHQPTAAITYPQQLGVVEYTYQESLGLPKAMKTLRSWKKIKWVMFWYTSKDMFHIYQGHRNICCYQPEKEMPESDYLSYHV